MDRKLGLGELIQRNYQTAEGKKYYDSVFEYYQRMKIQGKVARFNFGHAPEVDKYAPCKCGSGKKFKFCCFKGGS